VARFKESNARSTPFFFGVRWHGTCEQHFRSKFTSGEDIAKAGLSHLILVRLVTGEPRRRLAHKISLHKAASEVRYIVNFNNGSTTGPNGVSEFTLTAHVVLVVTTIKH
jgi:hypothetical protein